MVVDATFGRESDRRRISESAQRWGVPAAFLCCQAEPDIVRARLENRRHDVSDADWTVYVEAAARWESPGPLTLRSLHAVATGGWTENSSMPVGRRFLKISSSRIEAS